MANFKKYSSFQKERKVMKYDHKEWLAWANADEKPFKIIKISNGLRIIFTKQIPFEFVKLILEGFIGYPLGDFSKEIENNLAHDFELNNCENVIKRIEVLDSAFAIEIFFS
jgi:hypothetical protein